jgi:hypothetical protein
VYKEGPNVTTASGTGAVHRRWSWHMPPLPACTPNRSGNYVATHAPVTCKRCSV